MFMTKTTVNLIMCPAINGLQCEQSAYISNSSVNIFPINCALWNIKWLAVVLIHPHTKSTCVKVNSCCLYSWYLTRNLCCDSIPEIAQAKVVITADAAPFGESHIPLKRKVDEVLDGASIQHVLVAKRTGEEVHMKENRDKNLEEVGDPKWSSMQQDL